MSVEATSTHTVKVTVDVPRGVSARDTWKDGGRKTLTVEGWSQESEADARAQLDEALRSLRDEILPAAAP